MNSKNRLRVCLICVVFAAIVMGIFYYYYNGESSEAVGDGTLVAICSAE